MSSTNSSSKLLFSFLNITGLWLSLLIADTKVKPNILFVCSIISGVDLYVLVSSKYSVTLSNILFNSSNELYL